MLVLETLPAIRSPGRASVTSRAIRKTARLFELLQQLRFADHAHLFAVAVIGECLDNITAGALEVDTQDAQRVDPLDRPLLWLPSVVQEVADWCA